MTVETRLHVEGMKCGGCIANATKALENLPGFEKAEFDLAQGQALIFGDIDPQAACQALKAVGFAAVVNSAR
ncbi:MAG: heavy-metal-associated domain-containing protein [Gammaproteobacteria bacterium]|nr:heavy-metal-associated domain-containing protein [Gammaproteobacteria bacterium]MDH5799877.1 heavy-metal-associated domain-containing protein [Gammaproteobacteria bacterium]